MIIETHIQFYLCVYAGMCVHMCVRNEIPEWFYIRLKGVARNYFNVLNEVKVQTHVFVTIHLARLNTLYGLKHCLNIPAYMYV